jgi:hypothetical protein
MKKSKAKMHTIKLSISDGVIEEWKTNVVINKISEGVGGFADDVMAMVVKSIEKKESELRIHLKTEK